jgi:hypothetical protein
MRTCVSNIITKYVCLNRSTCASSTNDASTNTSANFRCSVCVTNFIKPYDFTYINAVCHTNDTGTNSFSNNAC